MCQPGLARVFKGGTAPGATATLTTATAASPDVGNGDGHAVLASTGS